MAAANPVEFWGCKFKDGMGMNDLIEWTEEWGDFFNSESGSADFERFVDIGTCQIHYLYSSVQLRENDGD